MVAVNQVMKNDRQSACSTIAFRIDFQVWAISFPVSSLNLTFPLIGRQRFYYDRLHLPYVSLFIGLPDFKNASQVTPINMNLFIWPTFILSLDIGASIQEIAYVKIVPNMICRR